MTADHAHTSQIVPVVSANDLTRPGTLSTLLTKGDAARMTVNYGTRARPLRHDTVEALNQAAAAIIAVVTSHASAQTATARQVLV